MPPRKRNLPRSSEIAPIRLRVARRVTTDFKRLARAMYPKEAYGYLLGDMAPDGVVVSDLWIPDLTELRAAATQYSIAVNPAWIPEVLEYAEDHELHVLGSIHSHPYSAKESAFADHVPSEADIDGGYCSRFFAICKVAQSASGRRRATVRYFGPMLTVAVEEY